MASPEGECTCGLSKNRTVWLNCDTAPSDALAVRLPAGAGLHSTATAISCPCRQN